MNAKEIVLVDKNTDSVCCDGGDNNLGHPAVYFTFNDKNEIICNYCSKKFVRKNEN